MKHTPGPWEWDGPVWQYDKDNEAPWLVQHPWRSVESKTVLGGSIKCQSEADARLIAKSPELYDLIKYILKNGTCYMDAIERSEPDCDFEEWEEKAKELIKQIEGNAE
jgi:hypothetical protein